MDSENNGICNDMGKRVFIVTQPINNLSFGKRQWALDRTGFKRLSDGKTMNISDILKGKRNDWEEQYNGLYAVYTDLLDGSMRDILQTGENRWQAEAYFSKIKKDFIVTSASIKIKDRISAYFRISFLSFLICRLLKKNLNNEYTCEEIISTLKKNEFCRY